MSERSELTSYPPERSELAAHSAEAHLQRGRLLLEQGRHPQAEAEFRQALAGEPGNAWAHALLAHVLSQQGRHADAGLEADAAVGIAADDPFVHHVRGQVLLERRHFPEALAAAQEAVKLDPEDPSNHRLLGAVCLAQERWGEGLACAERGLALDPEDLDCLNLRALALRQLGRTDDAADALSGALEMDPEDGFTHANLGWMHLQRGEAAQALDRFREALRLDPEMEYARDGLVQALKARYLVYRWLLSYYLWMGTLSSRARWGVILCGYFGYQACQGLARSHPEGRAVFWILMGLYMGFCLLSWIGGPLFNLLLRLNRYGRLVLSREERFASSALAICLAAALAAALAAIFSPRGADWLLLAVLTLAFSLPLSGCFACPRGWPRWTMAAGTALLALLGAAAAAFALSSPSYPGFLQAPAFSLVRAYGLGLLALTLGGNFLGAVVPRR